MCDVFFCISDKPVDGDDPRYGYANEWQVKMKNAPCANPGCCCYGYLCSCCATISARCWALDNDMTKYTCCQSKYKFCGIPPDNCHKWGPPQCCLCLEAFCCTGISMSATRQYIADEKNIQPDPCDNRIIRCNNYLQLLRCFCNILAALTEIEAIDMLADIIDIIAECFFMLVMGCMTSQVWEELKDGSMKTGKGAPEVAEMKK
eukprot:maker-scaffold_32-snap-gene-2.65-mRNA-1 protein AED:0.02 eAED:0.02 QI:438/1/1/1/1/1/3/65/203